MHENVSVVAKEMDEAKHAAEVRTEQNLARVIPLDQDLKVGRCPSLGNNARFRKEYALVNVGELEKIEGDIVDLDSAKAAGIIRSNAISIKLLGNGEVKKSYKVKVCKCSSSAEEKIKAAGGSVETSS